ncbi:MAG: serine/threonine protein kinase [Bryobacterales bacterium]|nr:serine/threonine protein kinase [Bryobacterales bacterium]
MQRIGRYEILSELGRGGMGIVYRAQDPVIGRIVAIKTIRLLDLSAADEQERMRERLFREARSAGILSHPNIVTIYDMGQEAEVAYLAMEFVAGFTLDVILKRDSQLEPKQLMRMLRETASALDYAHTKGIVHRDIKPGNIMVTEAGSVKITDFGVAKIASQQITRGEVLLGTPSYMSPEQIAGKPLDGRADQFALGVIAYELITGEKPFLADSVASLLFKIVHEEPSAANRLNPTVNQAVSDAIARALAKESAARYGNCSEFVSALDVELQACPGWHAQARGAAMTMETIVTTGARAPEPAVNTVITTSSGRRPVPAVAPPPPLPPDVPPLFRRSEPPPSAPSRNWGKLILILALVGGVVAAVALAPQWLPKPAAEQVAENPQTQSAPAKPAEPPKEPPKEQRPSPVGPAQVSLTSEQPQVPAETKSPPAPQSPADKPPPAVVAPKPTPVPVATSGERAPQSGIVDIASQPPGAKVAIDQTAEGCITPCSMELSGGRHVLRYTLDGHRPAVMIINVPDEHSSMVTLVRIATGTVVVRSTPAEAEVVLNGKVQDRRTPAIITLPPGKYHLELRRPGRDSIEQDIEVKDGSTQTVDVSWK